MVLGESLSDTASELRTLKEIGKSGTNCDGVNGNRVGLFDETERSIDEKNLEDRSHEPESRSWCRLSDEAWELRNPPEIESAD
jgi:hypothetical protein